MIPLLLAMAAALLFVHWFGGITYDLDAGRIRVDAGISRSGLTRLVIPPVGEVRAATHRGPLQITVTLINLDMDVVRSVVLVPDGSDLINDLATELETDIQRVAGLFLLKMLGIGTVGGILGGMAVVGSHRRRLLPAFALAGALTAALVGMTAYSTYDVQAFATPEYEGIIEAAPWLVDAARETAGRLGELGNQLQTIAANLYALFEAIDRLPQLGAPEGPMVILHVTDIHNNPAALDFMGEIVRRFDVDLIIDTGDLTDWGTPLEAALIERIPELGLPYFFVSGNHESPTVMSRLRETPNVTVLDGATVEVEGVRIMGVGDPGASFTSPRALGPTQARDLANVIATQLAAADPPADILALHNHRVATAIPPNLTGVILFGHSHSPGVEQRDETVYVNAGTTGAAGIRGLDAAEPVPFSVALLHIVPAADGAPARLSAVDTIRVFALPVRSLVLERFVFEQTLPVPDS